MVKNEGLIRYDEAVKLLPLRWQRVAAAISAEQKKQAEEFRLRTGQPLTVVMPEGEMALGEQGTAISSGDLEQMCDRITGYSRYAATETLRQGYLTADGGFRVGVCGTVVMQDGINTNLRNISSMTIRLSSQRLGVAEDLFRQIYEDSGLRNVLILSPPGLGKTTLLRDMIRLLSDGEGDFPPCRVAVVDERGEIAVMQQGQPRMDIGCHTDVLEGCPKALAIPILLRACNPQVIAVDEITAQEDLAAMVSAANCGVALLATIHAADRDELLKKPLFSQLLDMGVFSRAIIISRVGGERRYEVVDL